MRNLIDKYFKSKLDVPQEPPAGAWEFIQNHIPKKEKKRFFPLWVQFSGIAALALFTVGGAYIFDALDSKSDPALNPNSNESVVTNHESFIEKELELDSDSKPNETNTTNPESTNNQHVENNNSILTDKEKITFIVSNSNINQKHIHENNSTFFNPLNNLDENNPTKSEDSVWKLPVWNSNNLAATNQNSKPNPFSNPLLDELEKENKELIALNSKAVKKKKSNKDLKKKIKFDRFHISGFVSPMALNSFVGNSMLADEMGQYKTENNVTLSYGIKGAYALNSRVKIRTGVTVTGFEQITKNVPLVANVQNNSLSSSINRNFQDNINYNGELRIGNNLSADVLNGELNYATLEGNIQQQSQYIEIPIEAEVSLVKTNSIGISATGGGSTWLLSKNKIYAHTDDYTEELGKADNLNKTTFSANAGLKFDMNIMENIQINVEPNFKYLINPVNDIEKYNPYTVGVNAGVTVSLK